jgi:hypothetical protein
VTQAYPLHWPLGFVRTKSPGNSQFRTSYDSAMANVTDSLRRFSRESGKDIVNLIVSSNVTMMKDSPTDGGVAVYFRWDNMDCCIAVDRYRLPRENLQAIHHVIEAERTKLRHGGLNIVRTSFRGFAALPPPKGPDGQLMAPWWDQLALPEGATLEQAEDAYRRMVKEHHPDRGGDAAKFNLATNAIRQAREEKRA